MTENFDTKTPGALIGKIVAYVGANDMLRGCTYHVIGDSRVMDDTKGFIIIQSPGKYHHLVGVNEVVEFKEPKTKRTIAPYIYKIGCEYRVSTQMLTEDEAKKNVVGLVLWPSPGFIPMEIDET